jgi:hypothetical protein
MEIGLLWILSLLDIVILVIGIYLELRGAYEVGRGIWNFVLNDSFGSGLSGLGMENNGNN